MEKYPQLKPKSAIRLLHANDRFGLKFTLWYYLQSSLKNATYMVIAENLIWQKQLPLSPYTGAVCFVTTQHRARTDCYVIVHDHTFCYHIGNLYLYYLH